MLLAEDGGHFGSISKPIAYKVTGKYWVNNHAHVLRPKPNCDIDYLHYILSYYDVTKYVNGSTRPKLTKGNAEVIPIPLPTPLEQKRTAAILETADNIRRQRKYALEISSDFLQSVFLRMFGDASNSKGWDIEPLEERISFMTTGSRGWARYYSAKGDIFLRIQNIGMSKLLVDDLTYVQPPNTAETRRTAVKSGDLLLSMTADLGRSAVIPEGFSTAYINQHLAILRLKDINPTFVSYYISSPSGKAQIQSLDRAAVKSGLNFDDVKSLKVPVPPLHMQDSFVQIARKVERLTVQQREASRHAEHLFETLIRRAFRGEL